ncbi:DNA-binding domain-containing protein [Nostoc muscorum FACHB-395]|nr:DNA-binding domain-containing protein [Desmonostoc muscorum FACHB-395]
MVKPQFVVRLPSKLLKELNNYVELTGTSKTNVVVSALATYLGCSSNIPLSLRVAELETKVQKLQVFIKQ